MSFVESNRVLFRNYYMQNLGISEPLLGFDDLLQQARVSQINIQEIKLNLNYADEYFVSTESLYVKAYNEKSSLIITVKDPNLGIKTKPKGEFLYFLTDLQLMATKNTISLSKIRIFQVFSA